MKLYERFGERGYHTSIITTFGLDFDTYECVSACNFDPLSRGIGVQN